MSPRASVDPEELRAFVQRENLESADLDELVYDLCGEGSAIEANQGPESEAEDAIDAGEHRASAINNGGLAAQLAFIASQFDSLSDAKRAIMDAQ